MSAEVRISGLKALVDGVRQYFLSQDYDAEVTSLGWKQRDMILNQGPGGANRIVFYPGFEPGGRSGSGGNLDRDKRPSTTNPRALLTWHKPITMSVWAVDKTDTDNDELQFEALETLLERAVQGVQFSTHQDADGNVTHNGLASIEWGSVRWTIPPNEMRFGQEVLVEFVQLCPIFAKTVDMAFPLGRVTRNPAT